MLIDLIIELKNSIDRHGVRAGVIITLYALFRKERRNARLDQRDADIFYNQLIIMKALGVESQWRGQVSPFQSEEVKNLKRLLQSSQVALKQVHQKRRMIKMSQSNINWVTLIPTLLGAAKLILEPFGIQISDQNVNEIANGIAALATVIGVIISHRKEGGQTNVSSQHTGDTGAAV